MRASARAQSRHERGFVVIKRHSWVREVTGVDDRAGFVLRQLGRRGAPVVAVPDRLQPIPQILGDTRELGLALDEPEKVARDFDLVVADGNALGHGRHRTGDRVACALREWEQSQAVRSALLHRAHGCRERARR